MVAWSIEIFNNIYTDINQEHSKQTGTSPVFSEGLYQTQCCVPVLWNCGTDRGSYADPSCGTTLAEMC